MLLFTKNLTSDIKATHFELLELIFGFKFSIFFLGSRSVLIFELLDLIKILEIFFKIYFEEVDRPPGCHFTTATTSNEVAVRKEEEDVARPYANSK